MSGNLLLRVTDVNGFSALFADRCFDFAWPEHCLKNEALPFPLGTGNQNPAEVAQLFVDVLFVRHRPQNFCTEQRPIA